METRREIETNAFSGSKPYMNKQQIAYFKNKLILLKMELMEKTSRKKEKIKILGSAQPDIIDRSNILVQVEQDIRTYERNTQLIRQIDQALNRIEDGSFGYCRITGLEIGLKRLEALPFTPVSIQALRPTENQNQLRFSN